MDHTTGLTAPGDKLARGWRQHAALLALAGALCGVICPDAMAARMGRAAVSKPAASEVPQTVYFPSQDGKTELVGYLFLPEGSGAHPAVVMLHGRAGPYSSKVNAGCTFVTRTGHSPCTAATLSRRHQEWGHFWAERGYVALHVDSFGPRGVGHGFGRFTHDDPERDIVNERTVRPLDAYGALAWLRGRADVAPNGIGVQGWSNGGSTSLNAMGIRNPGHAITDASTGFRAAVVFYPGCGKASLFQEEYRAYGRMLVFLGGDDEEVSPQICAKTLQKAKSAGSDIEFIVYPGASHGFDDPGEKRQSVPANSQATQDATQRAEGFFRQALGR
jgi:dienelactone hydrolase